MDTTNKMTQSWNFTNQNGLLKPYGCFHSHRGTPIAGWFISSEGNPIKMDDLGVPP